jgi:alkylhydroperoxidase/carboxymuconolactone decarboxylase family protein YurZ
MAIHVICVMRAPPATSSIRSNEVHRQICSASDRQGRPRGSRWAQQVKGDATLDYAEALRRLVINDARIGGDNATEIECGALDPRTLALVRLAALVAVGGAAPSFGAQTDEAVSAGASDAEIVDVLLGVISVVGLPRVVAAAPKLAMALGYEIDEAFEPSGGG